jgi:hypothetical protein
MHSEGDDDEGDGDSDGDSDGNGNGDDVDGIGPEAELGKPPLRVFNSLSNFCLQPHSRRAGGHRYILFSVPKSPSTTKAIVFTTFSHVRLSDASLRWAVFVDTRIPRTRTLQPTSSTILYAASALRPSRVG